MRMSMMVRVDVLVGIGFISEVSLRIMRVFIMFVLIMLLMFMFLCFFIVL